MTHKLQTLALPLLLALAACRTVDPRLAPREIPARPDCAQLVARLEAFVTFEMRNKKLPALSLALLDEKGVVWAKGFGMADPKAKVRATPTTLYRVGSISKLFTDMAVMQLVARGELDLDAPIARYLPELKFENPYERPITLRLLMTHHAGILREPPVGHYFQPEEATLEETVRSLVGTPVVYEPGSRMKYSNAGLAVVGRVLEKVTGTPFEDYMQSRIIEAAGLENTSYVPSPALRRHLAKGFMWGLDRRQTEAPGFDLGMSPAANLYSTVLDLVQFARHWFAPPRGPKTPLLPPETMASMFQAQLQETSNTKRMGLGFFRSKVEGELAVGHGGAMYGFASSLMALPAEGLAVAVVNNVDFAGEVSDRVAEYALALMLHQSRGEPLPAQPRTYPVGRTRARQVAGSYGLGGYVVRLFERDGELMVDRPTSYRHLPLRRLEGAEHLVVDGRLGYGGKIQIEADTGTLVYNGTRLRRLADVRPEPCREEWLEFIGEYGWEHNVLYVYEYYGRLYILIEWFAGYPLEPKAEDRFLLPRSGLYAGEAVVFERDAKRQVTAVVVGGVTFARRRLGAVDGETFKIHALHPEAKLRQLAEAAAMPVQEGDFLEPELVDLRELEPGLCLDLRYATTNNFMGTVFYPVAKAKLQRPAAEALVRVQRRLAKENGLGLIVYDAYRPWRVTKMFWDATPSPLRHFVANPEKGSVHNRGCAVDLGLVELETGKVLPMVSGYDEFTDRAYADYPGSTSLRRFNRQLLRRAMEAEGFSVYRFEWWHFDYKDSARYPVLDEPLR